MLDIKRLLVQQNILTSTDLETVFRDSYER